MACNVSFFYQSHVLPQEMPIKDGRTACRELRQWEETHMRPTRLPLIAVYALQKFNRVSANSS